MTPRSGGILKSQSIRHSIFCRAKPRRQTRLSQRIRRQSRPCVIHAGLTVVALAPPFDAPLPPALSPCSVPTIRTAVRTERCPVPVSPGPSKHTFQDTSPRCRGLFIWSGHHHSIHPLSRMKSRRRLWRHRLRSTRRLPRLHTGWRTISQGCQTHTTTTARMTAAEPALRYPLRQVAASTAGAWTRNERGSPWASIARAAAPLAVMKL